MARSHPSRRAVINGLAFPTPLHEDVAGSVVSFFEGRPDVHAVLVIASCARGMATAESDLDMAVLVSQRMGLETREALEREWSSFKAMREDVQRLSQSSHLAALHLDVIDGSYEPSEWDDGGGPDDFEVEIGNHVAYSAPLWEGGRAFEELRARWLPYYDEPLAARRLEMARRACVHDLEAIPAYVRRGLNFQAFDRIYKAFREFLQALFVSRRTYPIAYNKWIRHQVCDLLSEPGLYEALPAVLEVRRLDGDGVMTNRDRLERLVAEWIPAGD